jgi:hypothetical protein
VILRGVRYRLDSANRAADRGPLGGVQSSRATGQRLPGKLRVWVGETEETALPRYREGERGSKFPPKTGVSLFLHSKRSFGTVIVFTFAIAAACSPSEPTPPASGTSGGGAGRATGGSGGTRTAGTGGDAGAEAGTGAGDDGGGEAWLRAVTVSGAARTGLPLESVNQDATGSFYEATDICACLQ